jgi:hypothetical protein
VPTPRVMVRGPQVVPPFSQSDWPVPPAAPANPSPHLMAPTAAARGEPFETLGSTTRAVAEPVTPLAVQQVAHQSWNTTLIPPALVGTYHRHQFIISNLLPRCNELGCSAAYKAFKEVELILCIASGQGLKINYHKSSVTAATPGGMSFEELVEGLHLSAGAFKTLKNKLTLYFRVWHFLTGCEALDKARIQLPEHMLSTRTKCAHWANFPTLELPTGGFWFIAATPLVQFKETLKDYIVSCRCTRLRTQKSNAFL